jgi:hypothetical protein
MIIYLAGLNSKILNELKEKIYVLESFAYINNHKQHLNLLLENNFILDSGAFTFIGKNKNEVDWNKYVTDYINFINKYDIQYFFELDIYSVIGTKETEELRNRIEAETNKKCIPVWHIYLGIDYYKKLCEDYKYIAIGASGRYDSKWTRTNPEKLKALVHYAKSKNVKVHGLGYTSLRHLKNIPFYSVDSTTWINGGKYGILQRFTGQSIKKFSASTKGYRRKDGIYFELNLHNLNEWIKFQKFALENL